MSNSASSYRDKNSHYLCLFSALLQLHHFPEHLGKSKKQGCYRKPGLRLGIPIDGMYGATHFQLLETWSSTGFLLHGGNLNGVGRSRPANPRGGGPAQPVGSGGSPAGCCPSNPSSDAGMKACCKSSST